MPLERKLEVNSIFDGHWKVVKILGEGAFGAVYEVVDNQNPVKVFALKIETNTEQKDGPPKMLPLEVTVLRALRDIKAKHYPGYECCGKTDRFNYVVMGLVGKNLNELRKTMPFRRFTLFSCLHIGSKSLLSLEEIHRAGYLHRDIKPANMCIGREPNDVKSVYILDWGLCRLYLNEKRIIHRPRIKVAFRGTPWYASVSALMEKDQGRCDDLWAWLFCLIEYTTGKLPWADMESTPPRDKKKYLKWLGVMKQRYTDDPDQLCIGCPVEYRRIYTLLTKYGYYDEPDYRTIAKLLDDTTKRKKLCKTSLLDWQPNSPWKLHADQVANDPMYHEIKPKRLAPSVAAV